MYELMKKNPYLGTFPYPLISWKGQTLNQVTSSLVANGQINPNLNISLRNIMMAGPIKLYRREIVVNTNTPKCSDRTSSSIDVFNQPGGSIINSIATQQNGLVNTIDDTFPNNTCQRPGTCLPFLSDGENAKRRVRSSGMIKRQFDISKNNDTYYTNTKQYLISRNLAFEKNQYNYIRQGSASSKPGDSLSSANVYSSNGINHCKMYTTSEPISFQYKWFDDTTYTVNIPAGSYRVDDINSILQQTMATNRHYIVSLISNISIFLLKITYNNIKNVIELQVSSADIAIYPPSQYSVPFNETSWSIPEITASSKTPRFRILDNEFKTAIGFERGTYPSSNSTTSQTFYSSSVPLLNPAFVQIYYKPSNPQFASQGGVSAAEVTLRNKFNTIQTSASLMNATYGNATGDAMAYGVSESTYSNNYTLKDKKGYPIKTYPKFTSTGEMRTCSEKSIRG
jgi:hypothetical protein